MARGWKSIETAPRDGTWFIIAIKSLGRWTYEVGHYDPLIQPKFVEVGNGLYRKEEYSAYDWCGFNNMHAAEWWQPVEPPSSDS